MEVMEVMKVMKFLLENWDITTGLVCGIGLITVHIMNNKEETQDIKE